MLSSLFPRLARPGAALLLAATCALGQAAELGEPVVKSYRGQPLVADFELTSLAGEQAVQVKLAHPEVYNGAGIKMHPVLGNLTMSVMRRDGRQFLHMTSTKPVETEYVHLFVELTDAGKAVVRGATLWFVPDPNPAPAPVALPLPVAMPVSEAQRVPKAAVKPAARAVSQPALLSDDAEGPVAAPLPAARKARLPARKSGAGACAPLSDTEKARLCQAIDYQNGLLSAQIVELEEKVRLLQGAIEGKLPPPASVPAPAVASVPKGPPPKLIAASAASKAKKARLDESSFPWLWIGIGVAVLALAGGGGWYVWRRKTGKGKVKEEEEGEAKPGLLARLKAKFKKKDAASLLHEEPTAE
jgi:hypothetical protein